MASPPSMAMMAALSACLLTCVVIVGEEGRECGTLETLSILQENTIKM